jgi:hypothetical protein
MEDGKVESWGAELSSVFLILRRRTAAKKHKKPRKRNWRKSAPVVVILAVLAVTGTSYYLSRPAMTSAVRPAGRLVVQASPSQLSGSASFGEPRGGAPGSTPQYRQQSSGISAITGLASPDPGHAGQFTPPVMWSPATTPGSTPTSTLSFTSRPPATSAVTAPTSAVSPATSAVTAASPAAGNSSPAPGTPTGAVLGATSTAVGAVGAAAAILGL